jgi:hypothetical protein
MRTPKAALAAVLLVLGPQIPPALGEGEPGEGKWFVLRSPNASLCWTARLIQVSGQYASGSALIAGGPFDSEDQARARLAELADRGTCRTG